MSNPKFWKALDISAALDKLGLPLDISEADLFRQVAFTKSGRPRSILGTSVKVEKGEAQGVLTAVTYLSPGREAGVNMCPMAAGCEAGCLGTTTGRLRMAQSTRARILKTLWFLLYRDHFLRRLNWEITGHAMTAEALGMIPAIRLNGSSDIKWEAHGVPQAHPEVQFYDYTKLPAKARAKAPSNYRLTFSLSERDDSIGHAMEWLDAGGNVAVVVAGESAKVKDAKAVAASIIERGDLTMWDWDSGQFHTYPAIDGDETDIRFDDPPGAWVVLYAKGGALHDTSGFVVRISDTRIYAAA